MPGVNWERVVDTGFRVPTEHDLGDLTAELTELLGSTDPRLRDDVALPVLSTWIDRGVYDDLLGGLGDGMSAGLVVGLGESGTDTVFRRSFSALALAECVARDNTRPLVPGGKVLEWGDRLAGWVLGERDHRGWVPGKGWALAAGAGADALGVLAASPHLGAAELTVVLDVLGERAVGHGILHSGEADRLAAATLALLRRDLVPLDIVEPWVERLGEHARLRHVDGDVDPFAVSATADAYLRALYLQLALGTRPPSGRADLLLMLVDALRVAHPHYLGSRVTTVPT